MEDQILEHQWPPEEDNDSTDKEEEAAGAVLKTRRSRKSSTAADVTTVSDAGSRGEAVSASSEPVNGDHERKSPNGGEEKNGADLEPGINSQKSVYFDVDEGTEAVHEPVTENGGLKVSASFGALGDDGLDVTINNNDVQKNQNGAGNNQNNYKLNDEGFSGLSSLLLEKSKEEHSLENNGFGGVVSEGQSGLKSLPLKKSKEEHNPENNGSGSSGKSGDNGLMILNSSDGQKSQNGVVSNQHKETLKENGFSSLKSPSPETLNGENEAHVSSNDITAACKDTDLIEEIDSEPTDVDLDAVLKTQNTHDLYCPNCNSCITRRVILRKRKRYIQISGDDKRNKGDQVFLSEVDTISSHATSDERHDAIDITLEDPLPPSGNGVNHDSEPDVFRCLSCLSFFVPTGDGLKLFKIFGGKSKNEPQGTQVSEPISADKKNWLSSMFMSRKESKQYDQVNDRDADLDANIVQQSKVKSPAQSLHSEVHVTDSTGKSQKGGDNDEPPSQQGPKLPLDSSIEQTSERPELIRPELHTVPQFSSSSITFSSNENNHPTTTVSWTTPMIAEESAEAATSKPQQDGWNISVSSSTDQKFNVAIDSDNADDKGSVLSMPKSGTLPEELDKNEEVNVVTDITSETAQNVGWPFQKRPAIKDETMKFTINGVSFEASPGISTGTSVDIHVEQPLKANNVAFAADSLLSQRDQLDSETYLKDMPMNSSAGGDTIVVMNRLVEQVASQEAPSTLSSAAPLLVSERTDDRRFQSLEIVKSIVYGGLAESITSLGIVSSAAGSGTTTLNILALGLANLIGGLFVVLHNLWDLKSDLSQTTTLVDRYQELLGRRHNFMLHAVVAIFSYLLFGFLPPVTYAFSFRASDDTNFKLIAVAISSLVCIILLAIGKASTQTPPKAYIKTVSYYVVLGFMASGVSYVAGDLIKKLVDRLGWFDTTTPTTPGLALETMPGQSGWSSY